MSRVSSALYIVHITHDINYHVLRVQYIALDTLYTSFTQISLKFNQYYI